MTGPTVADALPRILRYPRVAATWFAFEAGLVVTFWMTLLVLPEARHVFKIDGAGDESLWGFAAADSMLVLSSSIAAAGSAQRERWASVAMLATAAIATYPALHSLSLAVAGHGAEVPAFLMLGLALVNLVFAIANRPPALRLEGRQASVASDAWNLIKAAIELAILWSVFLWLLPTLFGRLEDSTGWAITTPTASQAIGYGLAVVGTALLVWSVAVMAWHGKGTPFPFDAPRQLVIEGPYRFVRNPQVMGGLLQGLSLLLLDWSPLMAAYLAGGFAVWQLILRPWEEKALHARFAGDYGTYRASVRCWLPRVRPYAPGGGSMGLISWK